MLLALHIYSMLCECVRACVCIMYTERGEDRGRDRDVERDTYGCVYVYGTAGWRNIHIAWTQEALLSYTVFTTLSLLHCLRHILHCLYYSVSHGLDAGGLAGLLPQAQEAREAFYKGV